jgi:hypothetical protein
MLIEASLLPRNLLNEGNQIQNFLTVSVRTFVIPFIPVSAKAKSYGSCGFGSATLATLSIVTCVTPPFLSKVLKQVNLK